MKRKRRGILHWFFYLVKIILLVGLILSIYFGTKIYQDVKRVETYREQVTALTGQYHIQGYEKLVLAIIYTESKGKGIDLMQSAESLADEEAQITTQADSLNQGVSYLSQAITQADQAGCDLETAVQSYNFGLDYINFIKENGNENSVKLAEKYSRDILAPTLGNTEQKSYRYWQLPALIYNGGYLYENGGNIVYSDVVKLHQFFITVYEFIF